MISIRTKVKLITVVLSVTMVFNIFVTYYLIQDEKIDAQTINIAGKQRMLTEKMIGELHRIGLGVKEANGEFLEAQRQFVENFKRLSTGDLAYAKNAQIMAALKVIEQSWTAFDALTAEYRKNNSVLLLRQIYIKGNAMLALIEDAVLQYEAFATAKRDFINRIQLVLGLFTLFIIVYMGSIALGIQTQLNQFLRHSSAISGRKEKEPGSELEVACAHIQYFLDDVENAIDSAAEAVRQSEIAARRIAEKSPDIQNHLDKSEDIVIEANEELYKTSIILKKLKDKLQDAAKPSF